MGVAEAIIISAIIGGVTAEESRKSQSKAASKQRKLQEQNKDKRIITPRDITNKGARSALVSGSPRGVLSTSTTSGRGTKIPVLPD